MVIEHYSDQYRGDILELVELLYTDTLYIYIKGFDKEWVIDQLDRALENGLHYNFYIMVVDGKCQGLVYGVIYDCKVNSQTMFHETFMYVRKEFRKYSIRFIREIQSDLQQRGIRYIIMTALENEQAEPLMRFYSRLGYKPLERHFIRSL